MISLYRFFLFGYLKDHKSRIFFSILGISLGIALFTSTEINSYKAEKSLLDQIFGFPSETFIGRFIAKDDVSGGDENFINLLFRNLPNGIEMDPILFSSGSILQNEYKSFTVIGADLISNTINSYLNHESQKNTSNPKNKELVLISQSLYSSLFLNSNLVSITICDREYTIKKEDTSFINRSGNFLVLDIKKLQTICNSPNKISSIIIYQSPGEQKIYDSEFSKIGQTNDFYYESKKMVEERTGKALGSLKINLTIVSLVSVLISFFMVTNAFSGLYLSRKKEFGILLSLGVSRKTNFFLFLSQAILLGVSGGLIGIFLGILFSKLEFLNSSNTLSNLTDLNSYKETPFFILAMAFSIAILGSILSAGFNAFRSYQIMPIEFVREKDLTLYKQNSKDVPIWIFIVGGFLIVSGFLIANLPFPKQILPGIIGVGIVIFGFVFLNVWFLQRFVSICSHLIQKFSSKFYLILSVKEIGEEPWKHALTTSTVMLSISLVLTLTTLTESYKQSLVHWAESENTSDFSIIDPQKLSSGLPGVPIDLLYTLKEDSHFASVEPFIIKSKFAYGNGLYTLHVLNFDSEFKKDEIIVSQNFCYLEGICKGNIMEIPTELSGTLPIKVQAQKEHFFSERGTIMMDYSFFKKHYHTKELNSIRVTFSNKFKPQESEDVLKSYVANKNLKLLNKDELIGLYLDGMDQVFSVLSTLKGTAILISFLAVFTSLLHYIKEKSLFFAGLMSIGMDKNQGFGIIYTQGLFLVLFGVFFGILSSLILSPMVIFGINFNAFGWKLNYFYPYNLVYIILFVLPISTYFICLLPYYSLKRLKIATELSYE